MEVDDFCMKVKGTAVSLSKRENGVPFILLAGKSLKIQYYETLMTIYKSPK